MNPQYWIRGGDLTVPESLLADQFWRALFHSPSAPEKSVLCRSSHCPDLNADDMTRSRWAAKRVLPFIDANVARFKTCAGALPSWTWHFSGADEAAAVGQRQRSWRRPYLKSFR